MKFLQYAELQKISDKYLNNQAEFYRIHTTFFETISLFIQAIREVSWEKHLYSLRLFFLYIFLSV